MRKLVVLSLLAMSLGAQPACPACSGRHGPASSEPCQSRSDPGPERHGGPPATLKRFGFDRNDRGGGPGSGQKLQHTAKANMKVVRPNKLRVVMVSASSNRELIYDGKTFTLWTPARKYYSTVKFDDTLGGLIDRLEEKYGVQLPMEDLFRWGTPDAPFDKIESAMNAGQAFIDKDLCDHYAFRQGKIDWQIWITTGSKPLPRKLVITNRADETRPQSIHRFDWNLKPTFKDSVFNFTAPEGATAIEILPRKTN
ncbi:MAG: DUF2092 domain-containing protein [Sulfuritalea sp.]|nr:DUF2092 domain-containing protein [Sulfuritalea sp.]